jgi:hypothetical protein
VTASRKRKRRGEAALKKPDAPEYQNFRGAQLLAEYRLASFHAKLLEKRFWFWEQRRSRLHDLLENEDSYS